MPITDRQKEIIAFIEPRHFASISEIATHIYTSGATVRRDLAALEKMGIVKSVYGGVVLCEYQKESVQIYIRDNENSAEKERIAAEAAKLDFDALCDEAFASQYTLVVTPDGYEEKKKD